MFISSHYRIGNFVYNYVISNYLPYSTKEKVWFKSGNILPDLDFELSSLKHTIAGSSKTFQQHLKKVKNHSLTPRKRLMSLGILCHFMSDYFCSYHMKEPCKDAFIVTHLFYELKLDLILPFVLMRRKNIYRDILPQMDRECGITEEAELSVREMIASGSVMEMIEILQKEYQQKPVSIKTDIQYTLKATALAAAILIQDVAFEPAQESAPVLTAVPVPVRIS